MFPPKNSQLLEKRILANLSLLPDKCKSISQIKQIHAQLLLTSRFSKFAASRLLSFSALSNFKDTNYALKLFKNIPNPNIFMWNTIIRASVDTQMTNQPLFLYIEMLRLGVVSPSNHTFTFLIKGCSFSCVRLIKQVHSHVFKFGFDFDLHVVNRLMRGYCVLGDLSYARKVFDECSERDLSIWTSMITGYAQNFCANEALALFDEMILDGFEPNGPVIASVLSACARSGCLEIGERVHGFIVERGVEMGVILGTALVHMYAKNGEISKARKLFDSMPERNVATWNAMLSGLASNGHAEESLELFRQLEKERIVPNDATFVGVLSACCHAGLIDVSQRIFYSMKEVYGIDPKIEHYSCMVDLFGRCGKLTEAEELMKKMTWKPDIVILGALLSACKNHGNIEVAERVVNEILALEPHNHMAYVVLSNMYAEAGHWKDVSKLRKVMKVGKLKKMPGWSLVGDK